MIKKVAPPTALVIGLGMECDSPSKPSHLMAGRCDGLVYFWKVIPRIKNTSSRKNSDAEPPWSHDGPPQNRTSPARKRSDGRPMANDQCLFSRYRVAFEKMYRTTSARGSFLFFQKGSMFSSKNFNNKNK